MATPRETAFDSKVVPGADRALRYLDTTISSIPAKVWATPVKRGGQNISALQEVADTKTLGQQNQKLLASLNAKVDGLVGALAAVAKGEPFDQQKLLASIEEATKRGVIAAVGSITEEKVTVVTMKDDAEGANPA